MILITALVRVGASFSLSFLLIVTLCVLKIKLTLQQMMFFYVLLDLPGLCFEVSKKCVYGLSIPSKLRTI